ncbi:tRNA-dihydrouridine synthase [Candidatus Woesebacteria bacterium]|nr:tRNA-dihydrouridine synthase [Candidatus Woesebacteria bacterium]
MSNFWAKLPKPFLVLAPMEDVTDYVFREVIADLARPDVFFTEFTSADGLFSKGREATIDKLKFSEKQTPVVAQIWGTNPENMQKAAALVHELGFAGVDINMGCPDKTVMKKGAGGAHCLNKPLAKEIILAVREGAKDTAVSVKTRLGYKAPDPEWIPLLASLPIDALTIHGRTAAQASTGEANWDEIGRLTKEIKTINPNITVLGNGDIKSREQALTMHTLHQVDGIMIGRGIFSNPWVFEKETRNQMRPREEYIAVLHKHMDLYVETWGNTKNFEVMKKFFKMYINNFPGASQLRQELMFLKSASSVREHLMTALSDDTFDIITHNEK